MNHTTTTPLLLGFAALIALPTQTAQAEIIYMTHQGSGSGSIGELTFENANFTITTSADYDDTIPYINGLRLIHENATISIAGVGIFDFTTETQTFVNHAFGTVGFTRLTLGDLFTGPFNSEFLDWDMTTELGPISGDGVLQQWFLSDVNTTGGLLLFDGENTDATFTASFSIPTPAAFSLLTITGLAASRRRRS